MNIQFETTEKVNGKFTVEIDLADIQPDCDKILKNIRKRANVPGFRPGQVPMGMIKRQYGREARMEAMNDCVGKTLTKYLDDNKIRIIGKILDDPDHEPVDLEKDGPYTFKFDVAIRPEMNVTIDATTTIPYYNIAIDDKMIDTQANAYARQHGEYVTAEGYDAEKNDMLKGDLRQLDSEGNTLEGGVTVSEAVLMPSYIKVDDQKKLFDGAKLGDIITFNPRKAYPDNDAEVASLLKIKREEVAEMNSDFSYQVTEVKRYEPAAMDKKLFDAVCGEGKASTEEEFRKYLADELKPQLTIESDYKFLDDIHKECDRQTADVAMPEALLKRLMKENNKDKDDAYIEEHFAASVAYLKWQLIREEIAEKEGIKVDRAEMKAAARARVRMQFAQYGMTNVPDDYIDKYADEMLQKGEHNEEFIDMALDKMLIEKLKTVVKLDEKNISIDDFRNLGKKE